MTSSNPVLPPVLEDAFAYGLRDDRRYRWGFALAVVAAAVAVMAFMISGSGLEGSLDTSHERQLMGGCVLTVLAAVGVMVHAWFMKDGRRARYLRRRIVWFYHVATARQQFIDLCTAEGDTIRLPFPNAPGGSTDEERLRAVFAALRARHPDAVVGYSPVRLQAYRRDPLALLAAPGA